MNANNKDYSYGFDLTIENTLSIQRYSKIIAQEGGFGIACSLNILAAEEAIKAIFILIQSYENEEMVEDFDTIFKDHKTKHKYIKEFLNLHSTQIELLRPIIISLKEIIPFLENTNIELTTFFQETIQIIERQEDRDNYMEDIFSWLKKANNLKNDGFYIGIKNGYWNSPNSFSLENFNEESNYTEMIISLVKDFNKMKELGKDYSNKN